MLQRLLISLSLRDRDLGNILLQSIKRSIFRAPKSLVFAFAPLSLLSSVMTAPATITALHQSPTAAVLPITGGEPAAQETAQVIAGQAVNFQRPFSGGMLTTKFSFWHPGIDLAVPQGTPVQPVMGGTVVEAQYDYSGYGNTVVIDHGNTYTSRYAHLSKINVKVGATITTDTIIGLVGSTGRSTGPHLHLEIADNGKTVNPLDLLPNDTVAEVNILTYKL